jgi:hypothetical protein
MSGLPEFRELTEDEVKDFYAYLAQTTIDEDIKKQEKLMHESRERNYGPYVDNRCPCQIFYK